MSLPRVRALAVAALLIGCSSNEPTDGTSAPTYIGKRTASGPKPTMSPSTTSPKPTASTTATSNPTPRPASFAKIRDNSSSDTQGAVTVAARLFVSKITPSDQVNIALAFTHKDPLNKDHPWFLDEVDWAAFISSLKVEVKTPSGVITLEGGTSTTSFRRNLSNFTVALKIDGNALVDWQDPVAWKKPEPTLFAKAGKYSISVAGVVKAKKNTIPFKSKPLEFQVADAGPTMKSLADLSKVAADLVAQRQGLPKPPESRTAIIDDVDHNRWFRFTGHSDNGRYEEDVLEVLLDPSGKEIFIDKFQHFTCVAQGSRIATPQGQTPIEQLHPGDEILSYDVDKGISTTAIIKSIEAHYAQGLIELGPLMITGHHPVFANGQWIEAQDIPFGANVFMANNELLALSPQRTQLSATVYDLSVSSPHTYFANGILLHNKARHVPIGEGQPWETWFYRRAAVEPDKVK